MIFLLCLLGAPGCISASVTFGLAVFVHGVVFSPHYYLPGIPTVLHPVQWPCQPGSHLNQEPSSPSDRDDPSSRSQFRSPREL
ncbi:hypothetical protein BDV33DRAFT_182548 [Aspergillus novoparasiticus]|uniref:Uncharacterized protein n=1 Tax=Aspergillus novoparasiticus TaxID=986946 RepID=A0A5N6EAD5_9EURO|nr:hypothetical protein BDV33DRAFT_182548 [Aspergillus novoparasiticus]